MRNKIKSFEETPRRVEIVRGLLSRMDADIVALNGSLPDVSVEKVGRLINGGDVYLSVLDSEHCFLETDSSLVQYIQESACSKSNIHFNDIIENPSKYEMKTKNYHLYIKLAGQRGRLRIRRKLWSVNKKQDK